MIPIYLFPIYWSVFVHRFSFLNICAFSSSPPYFFVFIYFWILNRSGRWKTWIVLFIYVHAHFLQERYFNSPHSSLISIFFSDFFRWLWRDLLDDLTGVDACAPDVWGRGANALHPRGSQFRPSDGHGDRSLWVAHGQRQPAHLAIDTPGHRQKYGLTSNLHNVTEKSGESKVVQNNITERICYCCVMDTWHYSHPEEWNNLTLAEGGKLLVFSSFWAWFYRDARRSIHIFNDTPFFLVIHLRWCSPRLW